MIPRRTCPRNSDTIPAMPMTTASSQIKKHQTLPPRTRPVAGRTAGSVPRPGREQCVRPPPRRTPRRRRCRRRRPPGPPRCPRRVPRRGRPGDPRAGRRPRRRPRRPRPRSARPRRRGRARAPPGRSAGRATRRRPPRTACCRSPGPPTTSPAGSSRGRARRRRRGRPGRRGSLAGPRRRRCSRRTISWSPPSKSRSVTVEA